MQRVFCGFNQRVKGSIERSIVCVLRRAVLWDGGRGLAGRDNSFRQIVVNVGIDTRQSELNASD